MKILQVCLCGYYNPQMGYQDNILPKYYKKIGLECVTVASQYYKDQGRMIYDKRKKVKIEDGIEIIRIKNKYNLPNKVNSKLRLYSGLYNVLKEEKPDIIFLHNFQFLSIFDIIKYCKKNKHVKVYADSHTDYINSATNWLSKNILHRFIWRLTTQFIIPYVIKFWGVTDQRCKFMNEVYSIPKEKIDILVMGADIDKEKIMDKEAIRTDIRKKLDISNEDFVVITGGKIDKLKNINLVLEAIKNLSDYKNIKLILFGSIKDEVKEICSEYLKHKNIIYIGWIDSNDVYDYFLASDLAVFPGTHSVLWEQAVGTGVPCIFKRWNNMDHVDLGGNCIFIEEESSIEIENIIKELLNTKNGMYRKLKENSEIKGISQFSYLEIAKKSIEIESKRSL